MLIILIHMRKTYLVSRSFFAVTTPFLNLTIANSPGYNRFMVLHQTTPKRSTILVARNGK